MHFLPDYIPAGKYSMSGFQKYRCFGVLFTTVATDLTVGVFGGVLYFCVHHVYIYIPIIICYRLQFSFIYATVMNEDNTRTIQCFLLYFISDLYLTCY